MHYTRIRASALCVHRVCYYLSLFFFFFNDTATTEIYTLSLHDALPIYLAQAVPPGGDRLDREVQHLDGALDDRADRDRKSTRLKLQSPYDLVCRLLLEKKKKKKTTQHRSSPNSSKHSDTISA